jgi:hypothetical protein
MNYLHKVESPKEENLKKRPPLMDFLDVRASIPGYPAYRRGDIGIILILVVLFLFQFVIIAYDLLTYIMQDLT